MQALRRVLIATVLAGSSLSPSNVDAVYSPAGSEFQINSYTPGLQGAPAVAADGDGDFVVVWTSNLQDGSSYGIFGQRFASDGTPVASEFRINSYTPGSQAVPAVAADADGDLVVAWEDYGRDGSGGSIFARRFASGGAQIGSEFQVNSYTPSHQFWFGLAADPDGDFVVAWTRAGDGSDYGVFAQRFGSGGARVGSEFQVNSHTPDFQGTAAVAADADGNFVVVWTSADQDGFGGGVFAQRFLSSGSASGTEFQVNSYTLSDATLYPDVAVDADGDFAVVWSSYSPQDGSGFSARGQRFDSGGAPSGTEFQVNSYTIGNQIHPAVAMDADGDFAVTWTSWWQDTSFYNQFVQRYDSAGNADGGELKVNTYTSGAQLGYLGRHIASTPEGDFIIVWSSDFQDGSVRGVFGQRFDVATTPTGTPTPTDTPGPPTGTPTLTPTATPIGACPPTVDGTCTTGFDKGTLLVRDEPAKEKLIAKMVKGPALMQTALGNPLSNGGTIYSLCIYDDAGDLAGGASVVVDRAGDGCGSLPCWKAVGGDPPDGKGYKYKDPASFADGVSKLLYKGGEAGKSKVILKGRGMNLPVGIPAALQTTAFATVQLRASDGICLSVVVNDIKKQEADFFKAKF